MPNRSTSSTSGFARTAAVAALLAVGLASIGGLAPALAEGTTVAADATKTVATTPATTAAVPQVQAQPADVAQSSSNPFSDVPPNSWAYQAVQQLASDGLITGYPDGTFKGQRPMTRYEVAVLVNRAVNALETRMASIKPAAPPPPSVSPADLAALRRLVDEFGNELKNVQGRVTALERKTDAMQRELEADTSQLRFTKVAFSTFARAGSFSQFSQVQSTRNLVVNGVAYPAGSVLPNGLSNSGGQPGVAPCAAVAPVPPGTPAGYAVVAGNSCLGVGGSSSGPPNTYVTGQFGHGFAYQDYRLNITGQIDPRWQYGLRLETRVLYSQKNGLAATIPAYCTNTPSAVNGVACTSNDYSGSAAFAMSYGWFGYFSPGGLFVRVGRISQDAGRFNGESVSNAGPNVSGVQVGYNDKRLAMWGFYELGTPAINNALSFGGSCVTAANVVTNCVASQTQNGLAGKIDYFFPSTQTDIGLLYDNWSSVVERTWNPATGLYQNTVNNNTIGGAFIVQMLGNHARPQFKLVAQGVQRFGTNPITGQNWDGNLGFYGEASFASKGNLLVGPLYPGSGIKGSNVVSAQYFNFGLNASGPNTNAAGSANFNNFFFYPNLNGIESYNIAIERWFTNNLRMGVLYMHWNTKGNVFTPLGASSCPGCYLSALNANALMFDSYIIF